MACRRTVVTTPPNLFRPSLALTLIHGYNFVYMINMASQGWNLVIATAAVVYGLLVWALAPGFGGHPVVADAKPRAMNNQDCQERTTLPIQTATPSPDVKIPPLDAAVPPRTETATFALG